jgi:hypothetical protein
MATIANPPQLELWREWCRDAPDDELAMLCIIALNSQEAELAADDRDSDDDHEGDIFADVFNHLKQPETGQTRDKQDAEPELKEPSEFKLATKQPVKQPVKKAAAYPKLAPHFDPLKDASKMASHNLAQALFPDDAEYV